jgi:hypothetical protein
VSKEIVSQGESFVVAYLDRTFGKGPAVDVLRVNGDLAKGPLGQIQFNAAPAINGVTDLVTTGYMLKTATGLSAAGPVTLAGTKVGDKVMAAMELTGTLGLDVTADFESTITVAGQIQQTAGNIVQTIQFLIAHTS